MVKVEYVSLLFQSLLMKENIFAKCTIYFLPSLWDLPPYPLAHEWVYYTVIGLLVYLLPGFPV